MSFGGLHRTYESKKSKGNNSHFDRLFSKHCKRPAVNHEKSSFQQKKSKYSIFSSKNSLDKSKSPELETGGPISEVSELISRVPPHPAVVQNFDESLAVDHVSTSGSQSTKDNVPIRPTALVPVAPCKDVKPFSTVLKFRIKNPTRPKNQVVSRIPEHEPVIEKRDIDMLPVTSYPSPPHDDIIPSDSEVELSEEHAVPSNVSDIHSSTNCNDIEDDDCISRRLPAESTEERIVNNELEESNPEACPSTDKFPETVSENIHEKNKINSVCGIVSEDVQEEISGELFDQKSDIMDIDCKINIEEVTDVKKRPIQVSRQLANHVREKPPFFGVNKKKKGISMYKHKFGDRNLNSTTSEKQPSKFDAFDMSISDAKSDEFSFSTHRVEPISVSNRIGAECANTQDSTKPSNPTNESKSHFTVIRNVKHAHQIQDSGEFQEFNDNVDYILDGMGRHNSLFIRCLSTVTLASKCMEPEFRMHLRAHSLVSSFFSEIRDAAYNPSLALCASTVLFVLSQDRLNMDLDRDSLQLMLNLLDTDSRIKDDLRDLGTNKHDLEKNRSKVIELVEKMKEKGHAKTLNSADISAGHLSMEALLSLTSKRAGEWFKEEIRLLGGLEYLTQTFCECAKIVLESASPSALNDGSHDHIATKLMKSARILKVIENVTLDNEENCVYMIQLKDGTFLINMMQLFKALVDHQTTNFGAETPETNRSTVITECIFDVIRIHINLSHNFDTRRDGSSIGNLLTDSTLLLSLTFTSLFILPQYVAEERRFEIQVISLTLLMNLIEDCAKIRTKVMTETIKLRDGDDCDETSVPDALVNLFNVNKESAIVSESRADDILDDLSNNSPQEKRQKKPEMINEAFDKLLVKAGCHMEHTLLAAYVGMVIGHLIIESKEYEGVFRGKFNVEKSFKDVTDVLMRFYKFMQLTCTSSLSSVRGIQKTQMILKHFETIETNEYEMLNNKEEGVEESMFAFNDSSLCEGDGEGISSHFDSTILHDSSNSNGINKQQEGGGEVTWSSQTIMMNNSVTNSNTADSGTSSSSKFDEL